MSFSATEDAPNLVHSELLCYVFTHVSNSTQSSLIDCLIEFYSPSDIATARELVSKQFEKEFASSDMKKTRRPHPPCDKHTARPFAEDISQWAATLMNNGVYADSQTRFYALNLRKVPPCPPEELNIFSLATRVQTFEKEMAQVKAAKLSLPKTGFSVPRHIQTSVNQPRDKPEHANTISLDLLDNDQGCAEGAEAQKECERKWTDVVSKHKAREMRRKVRAVTKEVPKVTGTAPATESLRGSLPVKHLFVNRVDQGVSPEMVKSHLADRKVAVKAIHMTSKPDWTSISFKIAIAAKDINTVIQPNFWLEPISCREWVPLRRETKKTPDESTSLKQLDAETDRARDDHLVNGASC